MSKEDDAREGVSRRTVLKGTAVTGAVAGVPAAGAEYKTLIQELDADAMAQTEDAARSFRLLGIVGGWTGIGPAEIDARTNPTLRLVEGEEHEVIWINGDGAMHNFNLRNEEGEVVLSTDIVSEQEASQRVTFTADPGLDEYFCAPHPVQMRGAIEYVQPGDVHELRVTVEREDGTPLLADVAVEGFRADGDITERFGPFAAFSDVLARGDVEEQRGLARFDTLRDGTYTVKAWTFGHQMVTEEVTIDGSDEEVTLQLPEVQPGEPQQVYEMALTEDGWQGESPEAIAGETNPTLTVVPGETYRVNWRNEIGRGEQVRDSMPGEELPGHNFVVRRQNGSAIEVSEFLTEQGETQTVDFVAEENLGWYLDQTQLDAIGKIRVERDTAETPTPTEEATPSPTPSPTPTEEETPSPTPTEEETPSPTPTEEETPTPTEEEEEEEEEEETPSPSPTPTEE